MGKFTSLTVSASLALSVVLAAAPVAHSLQETDGLSTQEIKESLSLVPSDKILDTRENLSTLEILQSESSESIEIQSTSVSIGDFDVTLPNSSEVLGVESVGNGMTIYSSSGADANTVIADGGRAQVITTIADVTAGEVYKYDFNLSEGQEIELLPNGGANVVNAQGVVELVIGAPWAYDANGAPVDTYYEVSGGSLVQVVSHLDSDVAYPVVADPIFLAPWAIRCLTGIGLNSVQITNIASRGTTASILAAGGYAALRCILGR